MKYAIIASALLTGLAAAHSHGHAHKHMQMHQARADDVVTMTEEVYVTETTTIWVGATSDAAAPAPAAPPATAASAPIAAPSSQPAPAPAPVPAQAPPVQPQPKPAPSSQPAPVPSSSSQQAPAAPAPSSGGSSAPVSGGKSTHMTYNNFDDHTGACGFPISNSAAVVAMPAQDFGNKASCGKSLKIKGPAGTFDATVGDLCPGCSDGHLDVAQDFAAKIAGGWGPLSKAGKLPITWTWA